VGEKGDRIILWIFNEPEVKHLENIQRMLCHFILLTNAITPSKENSLKILKCSSTSLKNHENQLIIKIPLMNFMISFRKQFKQNFFTTLIRKLKLWKSPQKFYFMFHNLMPWIFNRHEIYSIAHLCGMLFSSFSSSILRLFLFSTQDLDPKRNGKRKKYFLNFVSLTTVEKFVVWSWFFVDLWALDWSFWERVVDFCG